LCGLCVVLYPWDDEYTLEMPESFLAPKRRRTGDVSIGDVSNNDLAQVPSAEFEAMAAVVGCSIQPEILAVAMITDFQDVVCKTLFNGLIPGSTNSDSFSFNGNGTIITLRVDKNRVHASRVSKRWHKHFREWLVKETEADARRSWCPGINLGLGLCNFVHFVPVDFDLDNIERVQYSVWLNKEPLFAVHFVCRPAKDKNKKGQCELVVHYSLLTEYRRMRGVAKTAAKKQAKKTKKKIIGAPQEVFVMPKTRTREQNATLLVWKEAVKNELLDWFSQQHTHMHKVF